MADTAFISTTIPYVNARPHLGHALEYVQTDAYARYLAAGGLDVFLLTGSDENSLKNVLAAQREGVTTRELVDRNVAHFERLLAALGVEARRFIRTSVDSDHIDGAVTMWQRMSASGDIYVSSFEGLYCVGCEQFYPPSELVDGRCPEHAVEAELVNERNYFFRLSRYAEPLLAALESGALRIVPASRLNEVVSFVRSGLADISISRSTQRARGWGIPVPGDPDQVMYVWIDALTNYINALNWIRDTPQFHRYWTSASRRVHVVGKGVLRFHAVYWPAMLMSAGLPIPSEIVVHGYLTADGQKIGKTLGNAVDPAEMVARCGADALRYFLLADFAPFVDGDFTEERMVQRYHTDLANGLGNLVNRAASMTLRYRSGVVPDPVIGAGQPEAELANQVAASTDGVAAAMAGYDHRQALAQIWNLVRRTNAYIDERAPWQLDKAAQAGDPDAGATLDLTLHHLVGAVATIGTLLEPFLPRVASVIREAFAAPGRPVSQPPMLFPRLEQAMA